MEYGRPTHEEESHREAARAAARDVTEAGKEKARSFLDEQREVAAERMHEVADALRSTARDLDDRDHTTSRLTLGAADGVDTLAQTIRQRDVKALLCDAQDFARRSPAVFVGGAVTAGFMLARFLKSSSEREHREGAPVGDGDGDGDGSRMSAQVPMQPMGAPPSAPTSPTTPTTP